MRNDIFIKNNHHSLKVNLKNPREHAHDLRVKSMEYIRVYNSTPISDVAI